MYELGDVVRPSESYLAMPRRHRWLNANSSGTVVGYRAPKLVQGSHMGVVLVHWNETNMAVPMRWDQLRR